MHELSIQLPDKNRHEEKECGEYDMSIHQFGDTQILFNIISTRHGRFNFFERINRLLHRLYLYERVSALTL